VRLTVDFDLGATYGSPDRIPASGSRLGSPDELRAILSGRACPARRRLDVLHAFTEEVVGTRGRPSSASIRSFLMGGFTHAHVMEVMRAVALRRTSATTTGPRGRSLVQQVGWADGVETEAGP